MRRVRRIIFQLAAPAVCRLVDAVFQHHRSLLPERTAGPLLIVGTDRFAEVAINSLRLLEWYDKHGYRLVQRYLRVIVGKETGQPLGYVIGVHFEVVYSTGETAWDTKRIAACMVRSAVKARLFSGFNSSSCVDRVLQLALRRELKAMEMLGCSLAQLDEQRSFIRMRSDGG